MRLISWNVHGFRRSRADVIQQLNVVIARDADVVALQEVTSETFEWWSTGLAKAGYHHVVSGRELVAKSYPAPPYPSEARTTDQIHRLYFNLIASRLRITELPGLGFPDPDEAALSFPEKYVVASVKLDGVPVSIHNAHLPPGVSRGVIKVHAFEAIRRRMDEEIGRATILCGDFNAPEYEDDQGPLPSGRQARGRVRRRNPLFARWDTAEAGLVENPNLRDVYRESHRSGELFPASYFTVSAAKGLGPRRYDYILASPELETRSCEYLTGWLHSGLSDHAAVEADLELAV